MACLQIVIDTYDVETKTIGITEPFSDFFDTFCGVLFSRYGSVTFKTGRVRYGTESCLTHCINASGGPGVVFLLDSVMRPVRPNNNTNIDRDKLLQDVKMTHKAIPRVVWVTEERFEAIWGDMAEEKKQECTQEKLSELARLGADVSNPCGHKFFRVATESLPVDMIAYAVMLFEACWKTVEKKGQECVSLYTYVLGCIALGSVSFMCARARLYLVRVTLFHGVLGSLSSMLC